MALAAMTEAADKIGSAIPLRRAGVVGAIGCRPKEHQFPGPIGESNRKWKFNIMLAVRIERTREGL